MKYILPFFAVLAAVVLVIIGCTFKKENVDYLRIHIRANSNFEIDQNVKYEIKDAVVDALIPFLSEVYTKDEAMLTIESNFSLIESTANAILIKRGFDYRAKAKIVNEEFPTRTYDGFTLEKGFYDALILELGKAAGDNWWCVVYPPLCFINGTKVENYKYKSRILEIIKAIVN